MTSFATPSLRLVPSSIALLAATLFAAACSSSSSNGAGSSGDFLSQYCDLLSPCCAKAGLSSDPSGCRTIAGAITSTETYDATNATTCLRDMHAASGNADFCDTAGSIPSCESVFTIASTGAKKPGDACNLDSDCATPTAGTVRCASNYGSGDAKTSVCQVSMPGREGDSPCGGTVDGAYTSYPGSGSGAPPANVFLCNVKEGLYCPSSFDATDTTPPKCTRIQPLGGPCTSSGVSTEYECVKDAYCDYRTSTCKPKAAIGETCGIVTCTAGSYCDNPSGGDGTCVALLGAGVACTSSARCASDNCNNGKCVGANSWLGLTLFCGK